ncbi:MULTISPECIES: 30S ribosomal protein S3 [Acidiplasma]|jgi:small subunit ribosomal protein S3|uniref:Small ribosomal subunit protein uS3 n=2 Tax=Acidiplasma TaxID=507753 RepID=A0A0Q0RJE0_9ARCH|nr:MULTISPECIES: 30S ribosomal protein S3 [Acidiplasma]KJE49464.1 30S ribosomal protein S3 [Acidiplasma sp. MBA-1]KPV46396.1 30S ribosomal protein S3 [Acidiplasma aeolicum]KQB35529.1 30S ribosomal protein S3 [Acidiplasma cupricumulans]KQB36722.1 30S ribosomal protein S3 [Acidiplasma aeolicum]WMT54555.1 MAG: 30S ribosomal protein S3 [Acidiplasma sp.]
MKEKKFVSDNIRKLLVSEYLRRENDSAGFGGMEMKRTPFGTNITLYVNRPGLVIGRHGTKIKDMTEELEKKYKLESPQIEVKEVDNPDLNPQIISKKIALSLEKGWNYRKAGNTTLRRVIDQHARGVLIRIGGKISGERARTQKFMYGEIKYSGEPARAGVDGGFSVAMLKTGVIGVYVKLLKSDYRLPDEIGIKQNPVQPVNESPENNEVEDNGTEE